MALQPEKAWDWSLGGRTWQSYLPKGRLGLRWKQRSPSWRQSYVILWHNLVEVIIFCPKVKSGPWRWLTPHLLCFCILFTKKHFTGLKNENEVENMPISSFFVTFRHFLPPAGSDKMAAICHLDTHIPHFFPKTFQTKSNKKLQKHEPLARANF